MAFREYLLENLVGDLEYHPLRAMLYLGLGTAIICLWIFTPSDDKFTLVPLVLGVGGLTLLLKGIFLLRKTSDGLGSSQQGLGLAAQPRPASRPSARKALPPPLALAAQMVQDFGTGAFLLGPVLHVAGGINDSWSDLPSLSVFLAGAALFSVGWMIRRLTSSSAVNIND